MSLVNRDYDYLLGEHKNQDEIIYIDFDAIMYSQCLRFALGIQEYNPKDEEAELINYYKDLLKEKITNIDNVLELYHILAPFTIQSFFSIFLNVEIDEDKLKWLVDKAFSVNDIIFNMPYPAMATAITSIAKAKYVKEIHFLIPSDFRKLNDEDLKLISLLFEDYSDKIFISDKDLYNTYVDNYEIHEATTFITNKKEEILKIIKSEHYRDNALSFILCNTMDNMSVEDDDIVELEDEFIFHYARYYPLLEQKI